MVSAFAEGSRAIPPFMVKALEAELAVPAAAWPNVLPEEQERVAAGLPGPVSNGHNRTVDKATGLIQDDAVTPEQTAHEILRKVAWGRRKRKVPTRVHHVMDGLGWNLEQFTRLLRKELRTTKLSRSSVQFYASGERTTWYRGAKGRALVSAPLEVREAAESLTAREARKRGKPDLVLKAADWPNSDAS